MKGEGEARIDRKRTVHAMRIGEWKMEEWRKQELLKKSVERKRKPAA
jgi:hypothetical protein